MTRKSELPLIFVTFSQMISKHLSWKSTVNCLLPRTPGGPPISWLTWIQLGICITLQTLVRNDFTHASGESRTVNRTFAFGCNFIKSSKMQIIGKSRVDLNWPASIVLMNFYRGEELGSIGSNLEQRCFISIEILIPFVYKIVNENLYCTVQNRDVTSETPGPWIPDC